VLSKKFRVPSADTSNPEIHAFCCTERAVAIIARLVAGRFELPLKVPENSFFIGNAGIRAENPHRNSQKCFGQNREWSSRRAESVVNAEFRRKRRYPASCQLEQRR